MAFSIGFCASAQKPARSPCGAALVIVMLAMAVLLLAGTTFMTISSTESQIALNERVAAQAFALAEAAMHKALAQLGASPSYTGETNTMPGGESFTVAVTPAPTAMQRCPGNTAKTLLATASVPVQGGSARVQIQATTDKVSYPYRWAAFAAVPNQVVLAPDNLIFGADRTTSELWLGNQTTTDSFDSTRGLYDASTNSGPRGNIGANGDILLGSNVHVNGNVRAGDSLGAGSGVVISGSQATSLSPSSTSPGELFPSVSSPTTPTTSLSATSGTLTVSAAGSPYSFASMTFASGTALATSGGPVTIYVTGPVTLGDNVSFGTSPGTQLRIILKSDGGNLDFTSFTAGHDFQFYGSIYGKNTDIQMGDRANIFGSIIGRTILLNGQSAAHFDQAMLDQEICHSGNYAIRRGSWYEIIP